MLQLLESGARPRQRPAGWTVASAVLHASVIVFAIMSGAREMIARSEPVPVERLVFTAVPEPVAPRGPATVASSMIPVTRPSIDLSRVRLPRFDAPLSVRIADPIVTVPVHATPPAPTMGLPQGGLAPGVSGGEGRVFDVRSVERAVVPMAGNPAPDYPAQLRSAAVEGEVQVRFIVDADGRVERSSIAIVRATHALFGESVRRWLPSTRYAPAEHGGSKVRQLVEQRIEFRLR